MIQVADQSQLWGESFNGTLDDIFGLQSDIANRIAEALALELLLTSPVIAGSHNPGPAAYDAYLNGRFSARRPTSQHWQTTIEHYVNAVRLDPNFAAAHAGLADAYVNNANSDSLRELALKSGMDPSGLEATVVKTALLCRCTVSGGI